MSQFIQQRKNLIELKKREHLQKQHISTQIVEITEEFETETDINNTEGEGELEMRNYNFMIENPINDDNENVSQLREQIEEQEMQIFIPKRVFIVPYRNRPQHKFFFSQWMSFILNDEDKQDYEIYFSHQCDKRTFNRGAVKNIGFLAIKEKYPEHYKSMTFIFNDVDTLPFHKIFSYETTPGVVKHYYGYKYALGGIVVIKGGDFERTNGFPCYWGWGMEDNALQKRCEKLGFIIDRSQFYEIGSPEILQLFDGISRIISKKDPYRMQKDDGVDGLRTIHKLKYTYDKESINPKDNIFTIDNPNIFYVNITTFLTFTRFEHDEYYNYDLREPPRKIIHPDKLKKTNNTVTTTDDWSNIPYYSTTKEKRENAAKYLVSMGKQIPVSLAKQIQEDKLKELEQDVYNHVEKPKPLYSTPQPHLQPHPHPHPQNQQLISQIQKMSPLQKQQIINRLIFKKNTQFQNQLHQTIPQTINKFSPEYARAVGARPRAEKSANIRLGGVF